MQRNCIFLLFLLLPVISCYRSQYHRPPLSPECDRPKGKLDVLFQWKQIGYYDFPTPDPTFSFSPPTENASFIPYNNIPIGIAPHQNRLFITVPRRSPGIPSTLNFIDLNSTAFNQSPLLRSYPDPETNRLDVNSPSPDRLVSVYRPRVDSLCNRLWFIDTGILEFGQRPQIQRPSIWVLDLATGRRIRRFEIPATSAQLGNGLTSLTVDVEPGKCDEAFAYLPDFSNYRLHVYSFAEDRIWTFAHNYFYLDPLQGDFNVAGQRYQWRDGLFSVTLGPAMEDGFKTAYFHAMASLNEFQVSTKVLQNKTNAARGFHGEDFQLLGRRQEKGQSNMHDFDETTGVVFYSEMGRNSVGCWNTGDKFSAESHDVVFRDDERLVYPSDLLVEEGYVWVITNRMPQYVYARLDEKAFNFIVWKGKASELIQGTNCE